MGTTTTDRISTTTTSLTFQKYHHREIHKLQLELHPLRLVTVPLRHIQNISLCFTNAYILDFMVDG